MQVVDWTGLTHSHHSLVTEKKMVTVSLLPAFLFPPPSSLFITTMSILSVASLGSGGLSEIRGKHMQYSKFWNNPKTQTQISSRIGMVMAYTPAFLAALVSFWIFPDEGLRFLLLRSSLTLHFFKRVFEALFIHKYSGKAVLDDAIPITLSYFISTATMIYAQHLSHGFSDPPINLVYPGVVLFLLGIIGNFYHHCLLSNLRKEGDNEYKIPLGGLFGLVICPHYLFEILIFVGISFIAQTVYACSFTLGTTLYLTGRSYATRRWYLSKFEDFPKGVKCLVPFIF